MFRGLRLRLTALYLLVSLLLIGLVGGGTYRLLEHYFQTTADLALQHKMAHQFRLLGAPVPAELVAADLDWYTNRQLLFPRSSSLDQAARSDEKHKDDNDGDADDHRRGTDDIEAEEAYDAELAAIFVLSLGAEGDLLFDPNPYMPPLAPNRDAAASALAQGIDWRTVHTEDGDRVRLLTYRLTRDDGPAALQLGRSMSDQDRVLSQLTVGLLMLSGATAVLMGAGSWWLAGRSLCPTQRAWEQQRSFVANASHELRTPLTLIRASAEVAQRGLPPGDDRRQLLDDVLQECDHVGRLVEDLLLLSQLDAGRLSLARTPVFVPDLLDDLGRQVGRLAAKRGVSIHIDAGGAAVRGDYTRLRQVLLIVLDNALRHTPSGGTIRLEAHRHAHAVQIVVADTGAGIAPEHLPHVFERFYRGDPARGEGGGSGLGLSIAKALVEAHRGQISVESRVGQGTRVIITLPREGSGAQSAPRQSSP